MWSRSLLIEDSGPVDVRNPSHPTLVRLDGPRGVGDTVGVGRRRLALNQVALQVGEQRAQLVIGPSHQVLRSRRCWPIATKVGLRLTWVAVVRDLVLGHRIEPPAPGA
jgi:hypothetical protein